MILGRRINRRQRRRIIAIPCILGTGILAFIVWPSATPQKPTRALYNAPSSPQTIVSPDTASPTTTTTLKVTKTAGGGGNPIYSSTPATGGIATTTAPSSVGIPTTTVTTSNNTTTTVPTNPTVNYGSAVDPRFIQDPTNPLKVTYAYSASASIMEGDQFVALSSLPAGTLVLNGDGTQECSMSVGGSETSGTCSVTYSTFGNHTVASAYVVGGNTYISVIATNNVRPFTTTTVSSIHGGGSLGGLEFNASVTDSNGNAVTKGSVSMVIADSTQGWSYQVVGVVGGDGANPAAFNCTLIENYPSVGEYSGCFFSGQVTVTPVSGDTLTETATFAGTTDWSGSSGARVTYAMP